MRALCRTGDEDLRDPKSRRIFRVKGVGCEVWGSDLPFLTQAMLAPLPRWQMIALSSALLSPRWLAVSAVTKEKELP